MATYLYTQVADALRARIAAKVWNQGDRIPAEPQLCEEFGVSSITMRRAVANLVAEGLLVRWPGKGTFVTADHVVVQGPPQLTSFTEDLQGRGWTSTSGVLSVETVAAEPEIGGKLGLHSGALATVIRRVRLADDIPMAIQDAYVPASLVPGISRYDFSRDSIYRVLQEEYGIHPATATETYRASGATSEDAELLEIKTGDAVFRVERLTTDAAGRRIELVQSVIRGDRYTLAVSLSAARGGRETT
jgi:GntR family transcriptional regulator